MLYRNERERERERESGKEGNRQREIEERRERERERERDSLTLFADALVADAETPTAEHHSRLYVDSTNLCSSDITAASLRSHISLDRTALS